MPTAKCQPTSPQEIILSLIRTCTFGETAGEKIVDDLSESRNLWSAVIPEGPGWCYRPIRFLTDLAGDCWQPEALLIYAKRENLVELKELADSWAPTAVSDNGDAILAVYWAKGGYRPEVPEVEECATCGRAYCADPDVPWSAEYCCEECWLRSPGSSFWDDEPPAP